MTAPTDVELRLVPFLDLHGVTNEVRAEVSRRLQQETGLSGADYDVLVILSEAPNGRLRAFEIGAVIGWEKSRLSHQLTRMQQRGLIERSNCSEDRRGAFVVLTPTGRATVEEAAPRHVESVRRYLFDELSAAEVDALGTIGRTVVERLRASCGSLGDPCDGPVE